MINNNRIVPPQATDLMSLYGVILKQNSNNSSLAKAEASDAEGNFSISTNSATLLLNEPAKTIDFTAAVSAATVFFVPALDYKGFTISGADATVSGTVEADGSTLYKAVLSSSTVTITKEGL